MNEYSMTLIVEGREIPIPVLPQKLQIKYAGKNQKVTVLELGEVLKLEKKGLREVSWSSFFPAFSSPFSTDVVINPIAAVKMIQRTRDIKKPVRLILAGIDLDCNDLYGVESFDYEERSGELGDIYYTIKLTQWKDYSARRIVLQQGTAAETGQSASAVIQEPERPGKPEYADVKTYTVKQDDSLWAIAIRYYGDGGRYTEIYAKNQAQIDEANRKFGNSKYTIYAGQVFTIP